MNDDTVYVDTNIHFGIRLLLQRLHPGEQQQSFEHSSVNLNTRFMELFQIVTIL